jgi:hypothetical protein
MNIKRLVNSTCILIVSLLISGCGLGQPDWPSGTGYVTPATHRPSSPHEIQTDSVWEIYTCLGKGFCTGNGPIEYKDGKSMAFAPGATITNRTKSQTELTLEDYNGDECIIPYGMTVKIDKYGQYVPVEYNPELSPPEK